MSPDQFHGRRLEFQYLKSGIPRATPQRLASLLLRLPPILYIKYRNPISGYSKAPWGLSVLPRVTGIFTGTTISPGELLRQCPDHYAIRAGRNLPDKEFRYLRTVIVTAAVYWGFNSELALLLLTFQHRAGVSPYTSSFDFAETCVFDKQLPGPFLCGSSSKEHPFSRSYGVNLPSSLTTLLPLALESSSYLPVSVCGTGASDIHKAFLAFLHAHFAIILAPLRPGLPSPGLHTSKVSLCLNPSAATDYLPYVHRLRLSASP